jgi:alkylated DNA nucleotide flippase Atl1
MPEPAEGFVEAVLEVVSDIPPGRVMTYGQIAALLGSRGARVVGNVMARYGADVPW